MAFAFTSGERLGDLPAALSPRGVLVLFAATLVFVAILVVWRASGRRFDARIKELTQAPVVLGCLSDARLKTELSSLLGYKLAYLPTRIALSASHEGIEIWGGPQTTRYFALEWRVVESVQPVTLPSLNRIFGGISLVLRDGRAVSIALAGESTTGFGANENRAIAAQLQALMASQDT